MHILTTEIIEQVDKKNSLHKICANKHCKSVQVSCYCEEVLGWFSYYIYSDSQIFLWWNFDWYLLLCMIYLFYSECCGFIIGSEFFGGIWFVDGFVFVDGHRWKLSGHFEFLS